MPSTEELIATLSAQLRPVRRLRRPLWRAVGWVFLATMVITALALIRGLRADMQAELGEPTYYTQVAGAWLTGAAATLATLNVSVPDRSRLWFLLPAPFMLLWLSGFAFGCLGDWIAIPAGAPVMVDSVHCLETIVLASLPLALVLWLMLRRNGPLQLPGTAWVGGLAVAGFADVAHLLIHTVQASSLVLVINLAPVVCIVLASGLVGQRRFESGAINQA